MKYWFLALIVFWEIPALRSQINLSSSSTAAECNSTGSITISALGGTAPYTYTIIGNNCGERNPPSQTSNIFSSLSSCTYTIEVKDQLGNRKSIDVIVGGSYRGPLLEVSVAGCSFTASVTRGQTPYTFELSDNGGASWTISAQPKWEKMQNGNYLIRVTDACNVTRLASATVALDPVRFNLIQTELFNPSGSPYRDSFTIYNIRGGIAPYKIFLNINNNLIPVSNTGRYAYKDLPVRTACNDPKVVIQHACGEYTEPLKLGIAQFECFSYSAGTVNIKHIYGVGPYKYFVYVDGQFFKEYNTATITGLPKNALDYYIDIRDACDNQVLDYSRGVNHSFRVPEFVFKTSDQCMGYSSTSLRVVFADSIITGHKPITVNCTTCSPAYKSTSTNPNFVIPDLSPGKNTIKISDACNEWTCTSSFVLGQDILCDSANFSFVNAFICDNRKDGFSYSGDTIKNTTFTLKSDSGTILNSNQTGRFGNLSPGNYIIEAEAPGCQKIISTFSINPTIENFDINLFTYSYNPFKAGQPCGTIYSLQVIGTHPYILTDSTGKRIPHSSFDGRYTFFNELPAGNKYKLKSQQTCVTRVFDLPRINTKLQIETIRTCPANGSITLSGGKDFVSYRNWYRDVYNLNLLNGNNPSDYYEIENIPGVFNLDTGRHTYFNIFPEKKYKIKLFHMNGSSIPGIPDRCPIDSIEIYTPIYIPPKLKLAGSLICNNNNGIIQFTVENGTAPFRLQRMNATFTTPIGASITDMDSLITYSGLSAGTYYFQLTDACNNTSNTQATLLDIGNIQVEQTCDGQVLLQFYNLDSAKYSWTQGNRVIGNTPEVRIPLPGNDIDIRLEFTYENCSITRLVKIQPASLAKFTSSIQPQGPLKRCFGDSVQLNAIINSSTATKVKWNTGDTSLAIKAKNSGIYSLIVENALGCIDTDFVSVQISSALSLELKKTDITCSGFENGTIISTAGGGTLPYRYLWSHRDSNPVVQNLDTGTYTLRLQDIDGCEITKSIDINQPAPLDFSPELKNPYCVGVNDGEIKTNPAGGSPPYIITWADNATGQNRTNLMAGNYFPVLTDANKCVLRDSFTLTVRSIPITQRIDTVCIGGSLRIGNETISVPGDYTIPLKSPLGCDSLVRLSLSVASPPALTLNSKEPSCFNATDGTITISHTTTKGPYQYFLDNVLVPGPLIQNKRSGNYVVKIVDARGCFTEKGISITKPGELTVDIGQDTSIRWGDTISLRPVYNFDINDITKINLRSTPADACPGCIPSKLFPIADAIIRFDVETKSGCKIFHEKSIKVKFGINAYAPNILMSQSADITNQRFTLYGGKEIAKIEKLLIADRWGNVLFTAHDFPPNAPEYGWDGTHKNKDVIQGVYVYYAKVNYKNGESRIIKGEVTVVR